MPKNLRDVAQQCRNIYTRDDTEPRPLIATWPKFAAALHRKAATIDAATGRRFERLAASARGVAAWDTNHGFGPATPDPDVLAIAADLNKAELPADRGDAARILDDIAWATSGQLASRLREEFFNRQVPRTTTTAGQLRHPTTEQIAAGVRDLRRTITLVQAVNVMAETDLSLTAPSEEPLMHWETAAHRALDRDPSTITLGLIAHAQATNSAALIDAVVANVGVDGQRSRTPQLDADRLVAALESVKESWESLAHDLKPLMAGTRPLALPALAAGREAAFHLQELKKSGSTEIRQNVAPFLSGNINLAASAKHTIETGELVAPAVAVNRVMKDLDRQGLIPKTTSSYVDPVALMRRETVPVPLPLQSLIAERFMRIADNADHAARHSPAANLAPAHGRDSQAFNPPPTVDGPFNRQPQGREQPPAPKQQDHSLDL